MIIERGIAEEPLLTEDRHPTDEKVSGGTALAPRVTARDGDGDGEGGERNIVFSSLVREDSDIVGLVAYSIYKQNKLDWLQAFERVKGRPPEPGEQAAYIIGEGTPRRLATYRHLADATLMGHGPESEAGGGKTTRLGTRRGVGGAPSWIGPSLIAYIALAIVILVAFYLAFHFTARA